MRLSIIVPAHNEEKTFPAFYPELVKHTKKVVGDSYEVIVVDDGSTDRTLAVIKKIARADKKLKCISLSKNFGKEIATTAGIFHAKGEAVILIDADGQHPPELIGKFVKSWRKGNQVVIGVRKSNQKEGFIKRYGSKVFYKLFNATSNTVLIPGATDYRLIDRAVQAEFIHFTERDRITRGLIDWMGFKRDFIPFHARPRIGGEASYKISRLFKLALNSFVSLSMAPLYIIGYVGVMITSVSFLIGLFIIIEQPLLGDPLHFKITGTAMLSILILFLVGIILIAQGLVSIYLSHIHTQTQNRPLFIIDKSSSFNLEADTTSPSQ